MTASWLPHDCLMNAWWMPWLPDDCLMTAWWLLNDFRMTAFWLPDDCLMTSGWLPFDCLMTAWWMPDKNSWRLADECLMNAWQLPDNCQMIAILLFDDNLTLICSKNYKTNKTTTARKLQFYEAALNWALAKKNSAYSFPRFMHFSWPSSIFYHVPRQSCITYELAINYSPFWSVRIQGKINSAM